MGLAFGPGSLSQCRAYCVPKPPPPPNFADTPFAHLAYAVAQKHPLVIEITPDFVLELTTSIAIYGPNSDTSVTINSDGTANVTIGNASVTIADQGAALDAFAYAFGHHNSLSVSPSGGVSYTYTTGEFLGGDYISVGITVTLQPVDDIPPDGEEYTFDWNIAGDILAGIGTIGSLIVNACFGPNPAENEDCALLAGA
jgi:hypothetical protein